MATPSNSIKRHELPSLKRIFLRVLTVVIIVFALGSLGAWLWFRSAQRAAQPTLDGQIHVAGLTASAHVIRDRQGVPHITAASMEDLFVAQGYVTAQDRLWQMDITRRYAAGELSEALGPALLETDRSQRLLGFRELAQKQFTQMSARDQSYFAAYAKGVNAYIAEHRDGLPLEFRVLRYAPRAWTPEDSMIIGASLGELLTHGEYLAEIKRDVVTRKLGPQLAADLYVNVSPDDLPPALQGDPGEIPPPPKNDGVGQEESHLLGAPFKPSSGLSGLPPRDIEFLNALVNKSTLAGSGDTPVAAGSNNWVISGAHTASGKPLLSNDMHLPIQVPNTWYEAHLTSGDFDVAGVSLPGMPAIIVGHNRRIAWGFTNIMADVEDDYVEEFNAQGQYRTPQGWATPEVRKETILIKGGGTETMNVIVTRHGPIMTDLPKYEHRKIAMASTMLRSEAQRFPFFDVDSASNWQEFSAAVMQLSVPENAVYADVDGHIGYQATGLFPKRNNWDGALPVSGADDAHEWTGTVALKDLPSVYDPPSGILVTANSRVTPDGYPDVLSNEWVAPLRTQRIFRLLRSKNKLTREDMLAIQTDVYSRFDQFVAERLVYAVDHSQKATERAHKAADILRSWDGQMRADSAAAAIERVARIRLRRLMLQSKLGDDFRLYSWFMDPVWMESVLTHQPQRWLPTGYANWNDALADAIELSLNQPDVHPPKDLSTWRYGDVFPVDIQHPVFSRIPGLKKLSGPGELPQSGDGDTVKQTGHQFGPSERFTADLSDLDHSTLNIVIGQSGALGDPHFMDQWSAWYNGTTFTLAFTPDSVAKSKEHELTLIP